VQIAFFNCAPVYSLDDSENKYKKRVLEPLPIVEKKYLHEFYRLFVLLCVFCSFDCLFVCLFETKKIPQNQPTRPTAVGPPYSNTQYKT